MNVFSLILSLTGSLRKGVRTQSKDKIKGKTCELPRSHRYRQVDDRCTVTNLSAPVSSYEATVVRGAPIKKKIQSSPTTVVSGSSLFITLFLWVLSTRQGLKGILVDRPIKERNEVNPMQSRLREPRKHTSGQ